MHILLISRHYPPEISGGARRPSLFTKALRELGHRVTLVTPFKLNDPDSLSVESRAIQNGQDALHRDHRTGGQVSLFTRLKNLTRPWAYWPDDNIRWAKSVIKAVKDHDIKPDWIMTTSPPESTHIAGAKLSKHMGVPWIAEMRDTWTENPHRKILAQSNLRILIERWIARRTLNAATAITAVSEAVMREGRKYVKPQTPELIISHFSDAPPSPHKFKNSNLNLLHTGGFTLSDRRRTLPPLLNVLEKISQKHPNLVFHIAGPLSADERIKITKSSLSIKHHGSVSLPKSRALQAGADGLVLYTPGNSHALPGKYAEYVVAKRPILYFGGGDWLKLIKDKQGLIPLTSESLTLKKNEVVKTKETLTDLQAAETLIAFLKMTKVE